jgi:hypothetical protein
MAERINELQVLNVDQELALAVKNGDITKEEVERIWQNTTDLSANTPIATRKAVLLMKQAGSFEKAWPIFYKEVMRQNSEIMAAFNRDESKFAHLVAGTEAIVKTLQNVNPLVERLDTMVRMMFDMKREIAELRAEREEASRRKKKRHEPMVCVVPLTLRLILKNREQSRHEKIPSAARGRNETASANTPKA